jgi:hypothetical protein
MRLSEIDVAENPERYEALWNDADGAR